MKPFDLEAAKRGEPIVNRDGAPVTFVAHVPEAVPASRVIVLCDNGVIQTLYENGIFYSPTREDFRDIFMAPKKRTVWVNLYKEAYNPINSAFWYSSEKMADMATSDQRIGGRAWPLEIEE